MQRLAEVDGGAATAELKLQEQLEKRGEKEKRVEHLCGMIARRIMKKDLTRGWTTWLAMWEDLVRRKRMLQHAASSLKNPELSAAYRDWKNLWIEIKEAKAAKARRKLELAQKAREGDLSSTIVALEAELQNTTRNFERKLEAVETDKKELLRKLSALDGGMAEVGDGSRRAET